MKQFKVTVNGKSYDVQVEEVGGSAPPIPVPVTLAAPASKRAPAPPILAPGAVGVNAPMPGSIIEIKAQVGQIVARGDALLTLEALKVENEITAPRDGKIAVIHVKEGELVNTGALLISID